MWINISNVSISMPFINVAFNRNTNHTEKTGFISNSYTFFLFSCLETIVLFFFFFLLCRAKKAFYTQSRSHGLATRLEPLPAKPRSQVRVIHSFIRSLSLRRNCTRSHKNAHSCLPKQLRANSSHRVIFLSFLFNICGTVRMLWHSGAIPMLPTGGAREPRRRDSREGSAALYQGCRVREKFTFQHINMIGP